MTMSINIFNSKLICATCLSFLFVHSLGQSTDTLSNERNGAKFFSSQSYSDKVGTEQQSAFSFRTEKQKKLFIRGNVAFSTYSLQMSPIENEILDLEVLECKALLKRDTSILKNLWARDFTLDEPSNKMILNGKNPLPYYATLSRAVENFSMMGDAVYTSGFESFQQLETTGRIEEPIKRKYFHTWTRRNGVWKLTTKTYN